MTGRSEALRLAPLAQGTRLATLAVEDHERATKWRVEWRKIADRLIERGRYTT